MADKRRELLIEIIRLEIEKKHAGNIVDYLNNFWCHFDGNERRAYYRQMLDFLEKDKISVWNRLHKDYYEKTLKEDQREVEIRRHSNLFLLQTPREFYITLDNAVKEAGVDAEVLKANIDKRFVESPAQEIEEFYRQVLFPVYFIMREKGYSHQELCS